LGEDLIIKSMSLFIHVSVQPLLVYCIVYWLVLYYICIILCL